jgi:hypothetical protein
MSSFGQDFLQGFAAGLQGPVLKDYQHASKIFLPDYYGNSPKQKFVFHVYFNVNRSIPGLTALFGDKGASAISVLVKNIQLPSFQINVAEMNQYNRMRYVQSKIKYNPIQVTFHDDNSDIIRQLWYSYYSYYYRDPAYDYNNVSSNNPAQGAGFSYGAADTYSASRDANDFGFVGESSLPYIQGNQKDYSSKIPFFNDITIYGFNQHNFSAYTLINPIITDFAHDTYDYSDGQAPMQNTMTVKYELVKYYSGALNGANPNVPGFALPGSYDEIPSSITRPGGNQTILGKGGLLDAGVGALKDLESGNYVGAALKGLRSYQTFKNVNLNKLGKYEIEQRAKKIAAQSAKSAGQGIVPLINKNGSPTTGSFPTPPKNQAPVTNTLAPIASTQTVQP